MRLALSLALSVALPVAGFAGGDETAPPKPAVKCDSGFVYDEKTGKCVSATNNRLDVDTLYQAVRALSYEGRYADAQAVLAAMPAEDDRTLTYMGFTYRKMGQTDVAMAYYARALDRNPANVLARSYMGQGFVEAGNIAAALDELRAIRAHGGTGTWAEASLRTAIATGQTFNW